MTAVRVMSTLALAGVLEALRPVLPGVELELAPTAVLLERIGAGARGDVAILTDEAVQALAGSGMLDGASRTPLAWSHVGLAVAAGAARPDISTEAAVRAALLGARSVALSRSGASGAFMAGLLARLGIAEAVNRRATFIAGGFTAERLLSGEADLAAQQVSELLAVPGVAVLGRLPAELGGAGLFSAALFREAGAAQAAGAVVTAIAAATALMLEKGLEPVSFRSPSPAPA